MRDSDMFQNLVYVASLQQDLPFQVCLPRLGQEQTHCFGAPCSMLWLHPMVAMCGYPIYIASCKSADSKMRTRCYDYSCRQRWRTGRESNSDLRLRTAPCSSVTPPARKKWNSCRESNPDFFVRTEASLCVRPREQPVEPMRAPGSARAIGEGAAAKRC